MQLDDVKSQQHAGTASITASWQGILDVIPTAAYTCDTTGLITYFNPLAETVWGRAPTLRDAVNDIAVRIDCTCRTALRYVTSSAGWRSRCSRRPLYHGREIVIERRDRSRSLGLAYAHPVRNAQGQVIGAVNLVVDVTAQELSTNLEKPAIALTRRWP